MAVDFAIALNTEEGYVSLTYPLSPQYSHSEYGSFGSFSRPTCEHILVTIVRDGEDVGWDLLPLLAPIPSHHLWVVDWEPLVRVHGHTEQPRVGLPENGDGAAVDRMCNLV